MLDFGSCYGECRCGKWRESRFMHGIGLAWEVCMIHQKGCQLTQLDYTNCLSLPSDLRTLCDSLNPARGPPNPARGHNMGQAAHLSSAKHQYTRTSSTPSYEDSTEEDITKDDTRISDEYSYNCLYAPLHPIAFLASLSRSYSPPLPKHPSKKHTPESGVEIDRLQPLLAPTHHKNHTQKQKETTRENLKLTSFFLDCTSAMAST